MMQINNGQPIRCLSCGRDILYNYYHNFYQEIDSVWKECVLCPVCREPIIIEPVSK